MGQAQARSSLAGVDPNAPGSVYLAADANPGDIVTPGIGEEGRPVYATAVYIRQAVELRNRFEAELRKKAEAALDSDEAEQILAALSERDQQRIKQCRLLDHERAIEVAHQPRNGSC